MKICLSYILLFFYTLTCAGSSVYMHFCDKGSVMITEASAQEPAQHCPLCTKENKHAEEQKMHEQGCGDQNDCCKDYKIDLKKGDHEVENASNALSFLSLSPAVATLHWIILVPQETNSTTEHLQIDSSPAVVTTSPPYLIHCNFRI